MLRPLVSILVNNYNYAGFLASAIDSALGQDYPAIEVIVVDDGSTDGSRDIIARYDGRVVPVLKHNGGQGSAFNAGVAASHGEILCFLDSDDFYYPDKVSRIVDAFQAQGLGSAPILIHHLLTLRNEKGEPLEEPPYGKIHPSPLNLYDFARRHRCVWYEAGPTTTIAINRTLATRLFPIPEQGVRISADDFIVCGASLIGQVFSLAETLGVYRVHGNNSWYTSIRRKSPDFLDALQAYLNRKLVENGKLPVIRFDDSIYAWAELVADHRWFKLSRHMLKTVMKDQSKYTVEFAYHTLMTIGMDLMRKLRRKRSVWLAPFTAGGDRFHSP